MKKSRLRAGSSATALRDDRRQGSAERFEVPLAVALLQIEREVGAVLRDRAVERGGARAADAVEARHDVEAGALHHVAHAEGAAHRLAGAVASSTGRIAVDLVRGLAQDSGHGPAFGVRGAEVRERVSVVAPMAAEVALGESLGAARPASGDADSPVPEAGPGQVEARLADRRPEVGPGPPIKSDTYERFS